MSLDVLTISSSTLLLEALQNFDPSLFEGDEAERIRVRDKLTEVLRRVQSPWDVAWEHNWVNVATTPVVKTLIDMGVFEKWVRLMLFSFRKLRV